MANKINWGLSLDILDGVPESVIAHYSLQSKQGWKFWVIDSVRGYCNFNRKEVTVPAWARNRGAEYFTYYLSHELAHAKKYLQVPHGPEFMEIFKSICPPNLQHYEIDYKPRNAIAAGITQKDATPKFQLLDF